MFNYVLHFYDSYTIIFFILLLLAVIFEGPIIILSLSLIAPKLGFNFGYIFLFAFLGDFLGDLLHFFVGKYFKKKLIKKDYKLIEKIDKKLKNHNVLDKMIVIKYTPPITSIGLLYLGYCNMNFKLFIKNAIFLSIFSSFFISIIGYNFGTLFIKSDNFIYFILLLFFSFVIVYILLKLITKFIIKKIYGKNT